MKLLEKGAVCDSECYVLTADEVQVIGQVFQYFKENIMEDIFVNVEGQE